jgi:tetratricopeptide (TPR) repeat protein
MDRALACGLAVLTLAVYLTGASATIYVGDSGELVTAVHTLGIPHPSGYPLYVLLGKLWTLAFPVGTIAFRMSAFSAFAASVTVGITYALVRSFGLSRAAGTAAALTLAFSASFWSQANIQRVYTLNALFLVGMLRTVSAWRQSKNTHTLYAAFFLCGLGATNHTFMGLAVIALVAIALASRRTSPDQTPLTAQRWLLAAVSFAAGLTPYLYLPLRSRADPALDWGDPETIAALWRTVTRSEFWARAWIESPADLPPILGDWLRSIPLELTWAGAVLAAIGLFQAGVPPEMRIGLVTLATLNVTAMALHGSRSDLFIWHRYYIPTYVVAAILVAPGLEFAVRRAGRWAAGAALTIPLFLAISQYGDFDRSRYRVADDFSRRLLASLPPGAHLAAADDNILFSLIYLHFVEGLRPDIHLILQGVGKAHLPALTFDPTSDPLFFTHHPNWDVPGLDIVPVGLAFRVLRSGAAPQPLELDRGPLAGEDDPAVPKDYLTRNLIGHFHYMLGLSEMEHDWPSAARELARAGEIAADNDVLFYNLGLVFRRSGLFAEAEQAFARSQTINPRALAGDTSARASDRLEEVRAERQRIEQVERELQPALEGIRLRAGTSAYHSALADLLAARGEALAATGQSLRALALRSRERARSP